MSIQKLTPAKIIKKMGFVNDQEGIMNRYLREGEAWKIHLENTQKYILQFALKAEKKNTILIIGSGWWLDIPVDALTKIFKTVYLLDISHPAQIKHKALKYKNVQLIEDDITGIAASIYQAAGTENRIFESVNELINELTIPDAATCNRLSEFDAVVSVNILNQLDIIICDYLMKKQIFTHDQLITLRTYIQQQHIARLPVQKSCLITDYQELNYTMPGQLAASRDLIYQDLSNYSNVAYWQWQFDTTQSYRNYYKVIFNVMAVEI